jgi:polyisoprenoid-binding protein YceI
MSWVIDTAHTQIDFSAKHMMIATVRGRFTKYSGSVQIDRQNPEKSVVDITIDAASIDTHEPNRDNHLRSADFFDVANYPTVTFKSRRVELPHGANSENFKVIGDLTIRGTTHEVTLDVTNEGSGKDPWGNMHYGFTAATTINRKDFGLTWNVALETGGWLVGDQIKISIATEVIEKADEKVTA